MKGATAAGIVIMFVSAWLHTIKGEYVSTSVGVPGYTVVTRCTAAHTRSTPGAATNVVDSRRATSTRFCVVVPWYGSMVRGQGNGTVAAVACTVPMGALGTTPVMGVHGLHGSPLQLLVPHGATGSSHAAQACTEAK